MNYDDRGGIRHWLTDYSVEEGSRLIGDASPKMHWQAKNKMGSALLTDAIGGKGLPIVTL